MHTKYTHSCIMLIYKKQPEIAEPLNHTYWAMVSVELKGYLLAVWVTWRLMVPLALGLSIFLSIYWCYLPWLADTNPIGFVRKSELALFPWPLLELPILAFCFLCSDSPLEILCILIVYSSIFRHSSPIYMSSLIHSSLYPHLFFTDYIFHMFLKHLK